MKGSLEAWEGSAGPGVAAEMERVLVAFGFVFVFESVVAVLTCVLLFHLVSPEVALVGWLLKSVWWARSYRRSSGLSNFLGFLGQQSQMYRPLIFGGGLGTLKIGARVTLPVESVRGGSRELAPRGIGASAPGELGFKMDFSW